MLLDVVADHGLDLRRKRRGMHPKGFNAPMSRVKMWRTASASKPHDFAGPALRIASWTADFCAKVLALYVSSTGDDLYGHLTAVSRSEGALGPPAIGSGHRDVV